MELYISLIKAVSLCIKIKKLALNVYTMIYRNNQSFTEAIDGNKIF